MTKRGAIDQNALDLTAALILEHGINDDLVTRAAVYDLIVEHSAIKWGFCIDPIHHQDRIKDEAALAELDKGKGL